MGEQIDLNFRKEKQSKKNNNLESKFDVAEPVIKTNSSQYTKEYIKNEWAKDYYIFDVRDYESIGKTEWKDWIKEITKETVTNMVKKRNFSNSGHSSYLIDIMIKDHGWTEEQIVDYVLQFKEIHLNTLKNEWKNSIINAPKGFRDNLKYLKEIYSYYLCCCKNLSEKPELFESLMSKMKEKWK